MKMDQVACPVCTLFLREGMSLKSHLQTHPKSQVIEALVRVSCVPADKELVKAYPLPPSTPIIQQHPALPQQPSAVPQQQVTSITYQQFLSSTTSFVNPSVPSPAPTSPHITRFTESRYHQKDYSHREHQEINYSDPYSSTRPDPPVKYIQLQNYPPIDEGRDEEIPGVNEVNRECETFTRPNSKENRKSYDDQNRSFPNTEIGTVITDSHRVITSNTGTGYNSIDPKVGWEETAPNSFQTDEAHSPNASISSVCSVRVRKDLGDNSQSNENSLIQLTPPRDEFILPCFDYGDGNCDQDEDVQSRTSPHSIPLNIHTDESMPPRGELSGQGTNSSVWQVNQDNVTHFGDIQDDRWRHSVDDQILHNCSQCNKDFRSLQEWRMHISLYHQRPVITESTPPAETMPPSHQDTFSSVFVKAEKVRVIEEVKNVKDEPNSKDSKDFRPKAKIREKPSRTCKTCNMSFTSGDEFKIHIRKVHPLECTVCGKCFVRHSGLLLHQKRHLKIKPYKCDLCDKSFVTNQKLTEHHHVHTGDKPIKCPVCPQTFKRHSNLIQHKQFVHLKQKKKIKDFYCYCGEVFHSKKKLAWHQETHDPKPKQCLYCNERFSHSASLTRHIRRTHDNSYLPKPKADTQDNVECPICHGLFLKGSLRNHILIHSGMKPFSCNTCGKKFLSKWNMKLHQWTHAARATKPYKCKLCKAAFIRENMYHIHMRTHKNIRPYSCNHCGRQFTHKYNCIRHVREHGEKKMFGCEVCGKQFHRSYYLKDHMKVHTGVKPYSCHICSKTTATKTNHNKHLKTHHAREPVNSEH